MGVVSSCIGKIHSDGTHGFKITPLQKIVNKFKLRCHEGKVEDAAPSNDAIVAPRTAAITTTSTTAPGAIAIGHEATTHQPNSSVNCGSTRDSELQQSRQQVKSLNTTTAQTEKTTTPTQQKSDVHNGSKPLANEAGKAEEDQMVDSYTNIFEDSVEIFPSSDEEDVCSTCLEDYDEENPKITTQCNHHFHLPCIYEWMQKSATCPLCGKLMIYEEMT